MTTGWAPEDQAYAMFGGRRELYEAAIEALSTLAVFGLGPSARPMLEAALMDEATRLHDPSVADSLGRVFRTYLRVQGYQESVLEDGSVVWEQMEGIDPLLPDCLEPVPSGVSSTVPTEAAQLGRNWIVGLLPQEGLTSTEWQSLTPMSATSFHRHRRAAIQAGLVVKEGERYKRVTRGPLVEQMGRGLDLEE